MTRQTKTWRTSKTKNTPACPQCASVKVLRVIYAPLTATAQKAVKQGRAVLADCADWEGQPEWHCNECGCEWRGAWKRFKRSAADSA